MNEKGVSVILRGKAFTCECKHAGFFQGENKDIWECVMCGRYYDRKNGECIGRYPNI